MPIYHYNINGEQTAVQIERDADAFRVISREGTSTRLMTTFVVIVASVLRRLILPILT